MLDYLLQDFHFPFYRCEQFHLASFHSNGRQWQNGGVRILVFFIFTAKLVHGDESLVVSVVTTTSTLIALFFQALFWRLLATISGEI
jgi:hypothetical protein